MLALGSANGISALLAVFQFRAVGFPGLVVEVAECLEWGRQPLLAFGKRRRMHVQVLGQFGVIAALRQSPQIESKQINPQRGRKSAPAGRRGSSHDRPLQGTEL